MVGRLLSMFGVEVSKFNGTKLNRIVRLTLDAVYIFIQCGERARRRTKRLEGIGVWVGRGDIAKWSWIRGRNKRTQAIEGRGTIVDGLLLLTIRTVTTERQTPLAYANSLRDAMRDVGERCRVDGRHPDACLVDLEELGDERIEVDVCVSKVIKGQFLPIPT